MQTHAHFDRCGLPRFVLQAALDFECGFEGIIRRVERRTEGITDDLEDVAVLRLDRFAQNCVMVCEEGWQLGGELLRQRGAAFNVGEQKGDGAGGQFSHQISPMPA